MQQTAIVLGLVHLFVACGGVAGEPEPEADAGDSFAPSVLSVDPADGEIGVAADAAVFIEFSEPMDQSSVESAFLSQTLTEVSFSWSESGDVVKIIPAALLPLAEGASIDPDSVEAASFDVVVGTSATDLLGNQLGTAFVSSFSTEKRMTVDLESVPELTGIRRSDGSSTSLGLSLTVGDSSADAQTKTFLSFKAPVFPSGAVIESATLLGNQTSTQNTPYVLGDIEAFHVNGDDLDDIFDEALAAIGDFSVAQETGVKSIDVTGSLLDDLAERVERGNRTQYRLEFQTPTNSNGVADLAHFGPKTFGLRVVFRAD